MTTFWKWVLSRIKKQLSEKINCGIWERERLTSQIFLNVWICWISAWRATRTSTNLVLYAWKVSLKETVGVACGVSSFRRCGLYCQRRSQFTPPKSSNLVLSLKSASFQAFSWWMLQNCMRIWCLIKEESAPDSFLPNLSSIVDLNVVILIMMFTTVIVIKFLL